MVTTIPPQRQDRRWETLYLCLVSKGTNRETVLRTITALHHLQQGHRIRLVLLTEEGRDFDAAQLGCDVIFVPHDYSPPLARYKARKLEYFRIHRLRERDWALHLDEETLVDNHCIQACVDFIERTSWEWGQGIITYNTVNYWLNPVLTFGDILRFRDDLGRFQFQHGRLHKSIWGCHGSFLLSSGKVENAVGWNTDCLAEDFWFADKAWRLGYGGGFVPSVAREQSNWTVMDFINQRRRWFCGIWKAGFYGKLTRTTWFLSILELPMVISYWTGSFAVPWYIRLWMSFHLGAETVTVVVALVVQDIDAAVPPLNILWHILLIPVLTFIVNLSTLR